MNRLSAMLAAACVASGVCAAQDAPKLHDTMQDLAFLNGAFEIDAKWAFGPTLDGLAFYAPTLGGRFIESDVYPSDNGQQRYHRYHSVYAYDAEAKVVTAYAFTFDGSVSVTEHEMKGEAGDLHYESTWPDGRVREKFGQGEEGTLDWTVWMRDPSSPDDAPVWREVLSDEWTPAPGAERPELPTPDLQGPMKDLAGFLGEWEVSMDGPKSFWSRSEFHVGIAGQVLRADTYAKNERGEQYKRYTTYFTWNPETESYKAYGFLFDGSVQITDVTVEHGDDGKPARMTTEWTQENGPQTFVFRQTVDVPGAGADNGSDMYGFRMSYRQDTRSEWIEAMQGEWHRVNGNAASSPGAQDKTKAGEG